MYPRVLIFGESFHLKSGGGITLTNLFYGWPKNKIAVVTTEENINKSNGTICNKYYQLGYNENKKRFPFNLFQKKRESKIIEKYNQESTAKLNRKEDNYKMCKIFYNALNNLGVISVVEKYIVSQNLLSFIKDFNPDLIYTQLGSFSYVMFVNEVYSTLKIPYVIHIMDDWPKYITSKAVISLFYKKQFSEELQHAIENAKGHLAISEYMANEYYNRYKKRFHVFHNCIDVSFWEVNVRINNHQQKNKFVFLYAGRIGPGISNSLKLFSDALKKIDVSGKYRLKFEIQTKDISHPIINILRKEKHVNILPQIEYNELPQKFSSVDFLVLPIDFDKKNIEFIKYSMATKVPEYMISGTPIIFFGPPDTAMSIFFKDKKVGFVINNIAQKNIEKGILEALQGEQKRKTIVKNAIKIAKKDFDAEIVRKEFIKYINKIHEKQ